MDQVAPISKYPPTYIPIVVSGTCLSSGSDVYPNTMNKANVNVTAHPRESSDSAYQMKQETMNKATQNNQEPSVMSSIIADCFLCGACGGIRTPDPLLTKQPLYH